MSSSMAHTPLIQPEECIGILGGGQLGRLLALAAGYLSLKTHVFAPEAHSPAFDVATRHSCAAYDDFTALEAFARDVRVVTYETENIPLSTVQFLQKYCPVHPDPAILAITQDRYLEKEFLTSLHLPVAPYYLLKDEGDLRRQQAIDPGPYLLKTRCQGYDGRGQIYLPESSPAALLKEAALLLQRPDSTVLEKYISFASEISVLAARNSKGAFCAYDVCENIHKDQMLIQTNVPASVPNAIQHQAIALAQKLCVALNYVGVLAVEMFYIGSNSGSEALIFNELAPRVHNSGHWTDRGALTSQFEQHIRAICGWPLGSVRRHGSVILQNIIGEDVHNWHTYLQETDTSLCLYGKGPARLKRKMGHTIQFL